MQLGELLAIKAEPKHQPTQQLVPETGAGQDLTVLEEEEEVVVPEDATWRSSTKLKAMLEELSAIRRADPRAKCIIFSQWTSMLNLIEVCPYRKREEKGEERMLGGREQRLPMSWVLVGGWCAKRALQRHRFQFVRLDGSLAQTERAGVLERFKRDPDITVCP